jgi:hypothetical protein
MLPCVGLRRPPRHQLRALEQSQDRDGGEVLLVAGDQRRVGAGGEVVGKVNTLAVRKFTSAPI